MLCIHLPIALLVCCCFHCSPIRPTILVRQLPDQLGCNHPTGTGCSSLNLTRLSAFPHVQYANCTLRYCSSPLCHNNTATPPFVSISGECFYHLYSQGRRSREGWRGFRPPNFKQIIKINRKIQIIENSSSFKVRD